MDKFIRHRWVIGLHILLMCAAYLITPFLDDDTYKYHYQIVALAWFVLPAFLLYCFYQTKAQMILILFTLLSLNNLVDEVFFDPQEFSWNELVFVLAGPLIIIWKLKW